MLRSLLAAAFKLFWQINTVFLKHLKVKLQCTLSLSPAGSSDSFVHSKCPSSYPILTPGTNPSTIFKSKRNVLSRRFTIEFGCSTRHPARLLWNCRFRKVTKH